MWGVATAEGELGIDCFYAFDAEGLGLDLFLDQVSHRAHGAGETEGYVYVTAVIVDTDVVDQTKLHKVHPDLRVYYIPQLVRDALLG